MSLDDSLAPLLAQRQVQDRYRQRRTLESAQAVEVSVDGRRLINFCSNDYLGLANSLSARTAMQQASEQVGVGSGASHLVCGHTHHHHALENELAAITQRERALLFSTGYMANIGVIQALVERDDVVFEDKWNHASLIDGVTLSRAKRQRYRHNDLSHLEALLRRHRSARRKLIVTDGVFSMDGDHAPLTALAMLAKRYDAWLMVDDAHGFGCLGESGGGLAEALNLSQAELPILIGTLGKAIGGFGAFVAGSEVLIETLIQSARSYIYTTAMPPAVAAATLCNVRLMATDPSYQHTLRARVDYFRAACAQAKLPLTSSVSAIQPIIIGDDRRAVQLSQLLQQAGFWVVAIRPPTVPDGTARLRVTVTAAHTPAHIDALVSALVDAMAQIDSECL